MLYISIGQNEIKLTRGIATISLDYTKNSVIYFRCLSLRHNMLKKEFLAD